MTSLAAAIGEGEGLPTSSAGTGVAVASTKPSGPANWLAELPNAAYHVW
jgi:hypothetical protein